MRENDLQELINLRRKFHSIPELSLHEHKTAAEIEKYLNNIGIQSVRIGKTGITAMIWSDNHDRKKQKTIALRAEIDGVAVQEQIEWEYQSQNTGVMHACGHDAIVATVLFTAKHLFEHKSKLPVNVRLIFQPAEENGVGTDIMINGGVMDDLKVDVFMMYHYVNDALLGMELSKGASSAAIGKIKINIIGKGSHWSMAEYGHDAIMAAADILKLTQKINHNYQTTSPFIIGIGQIQGGTSPNVISGNAHLDGTLRAAKLTDYHALREQFITEANIISERTKTKMEIEVDSEPIKPIFSNRNLVDYGMKTGQEVFANGA